MAYMDQAEYRDQGKRHQEPGRQQGGERPDRIGSHGVTQLLR